MAIETVLMTLGIIVLIEGLVITLALEDVKKICARCGRNKKFLRKFGLWELIVGAFLLIAGIFLVAG